jgi:NADPH-dependent 2,4-dienoyl-CoA reductase/sulfur reductase-like enzyme
LNKAFGEEIWDHLAILDKAFFRSGDTPTLFAAFFYFASPSRVFGFRTIDDCNAIVLKAKQSKRAAVIGGGLLGLEAARGLLGHGCEVHVVHLAGISWRCSSTPPAATY